MPDTFARMRQLVGTTVEWAANDLVIGLGEIAVERAGAAFKIKVGDGASRFSALPYAVAGEGSVEWADIVGKPTSFPASPHHHEPEDITGLVDASGNIDMAVIPDTLKERLDWKGLHTPTTLVPYPQFPAAGDTWGIAGPSFTFTTGTLAGKTVSEGAMIVFDAARWYLVSGGSTVNPADFVRTADLRTITTGTTDAGKVPQLNTSGRLDPSFLDIPGALQFRGVVDIKLPVPSSVNSGDYYLVGIGGVAHASWVGIAGQTMLVNDQVIWNGIQWSYIRPEGGASGFLPIDGSAPMLGALALAPYTAGQPAAAHAIRKDYLDTAIADVPTAEESLGFLPLNPANNLSELADDATARGNLGLGTIATAPSSAYVPTSLFLNANELLVASGPGAVTRLAAPTIDGQVLGHSGGTVGWTLGSAQYLLKNQNLADVPDKAQARINLGVPDLADIILKSTVDAAGDLIVGTAPDTVARFPKGTPGQVLVSTAGGIAWGSGLSLFSEVRLAAPATEILLPVPQGAKLIKFSYELSNTDTGDKGFFLQVMTGSTVIAAGYVDSMTYGLGASDTSGAGAVTYSYLTHRTFWPIGTGQDIFGELSGSLGPGKRNDYMFLTGMAGMITWQAVPWVNWSVALGVQVTRANVTQFRIYTQASNISTGSFARVYAM